MIDKIKMFEQLYLKNLNEQLDVHLSTFNKKSFDSDLKEIDEFLRDPNILLESIQGLQREQQVAIGDIKMKLKELSQIKVDLIKSNSFETSLYKPDENLLYFNKLFFGSLRLKYYFHPFDSKILVDNQSIDLINLCEFWSVYFEEYKSDPFAFIFCLINKDNKPFKSLIKQNNNGFAILSSATKGPSFGQSDISIGNSSNDKSNWANLGHSYDNPPENIDKKYLLAGSSYLS